MNAVAPISEAHDLVNYDAEKAFLGACLANNDVWHRMADRLRPEHFGDALHARIFEAIGQTIRRNIRADIPLLRKQFDRDQALLEYGGARYLADLASSVVTILDAHNYAESIIDLWQRREINKAAGQAIAEVAAFSPERSAVDVVEALESKLSDIASSGGSERAIVSASEAAMCAVRSAEAVMKQGGAVGVRTGLADLDRILNGLQRPDLVILAGRPSMGKTALATNIGFNAARTPQPRGPHRVAFFSLEMSAEQLGARLISMETGFTVDKQRSQFIGNNDITAMMEASQRLQDVPLWIDDDASGTVQGMTARARRIQRSRGLDLVIVDHLGRIKTAKGEKSFGLYERTTTIVRDCKSMAKTLDVPVLLLVQLSRQVEQRDDKRPQLSDLRDSGAIEEEADVVMFVYREEYYLERAEPKQNAGEPPDKYDKRKQAWNVQMMNAHNVAEVLVAKNRQGPIRSTKIRFDGPRQLFQDLQA